MDKEKIYATIIILTYNQVDKVARAIESVLAQECKFRYEILIADDCSADGTREVCQQYASRYPEKIRLVPIHPNKGIVDNYFDAVLEAKGEYVGDCAGDDEWLSNTRLEEQIQQLESDKSLSAVSTVVEWFDVKTGNKTYVRSSLVPPESADRPFRMRGREVTKEILNLGGADTIPFVLSSALYRKAPVERLLKREPEVIRCKDGGVEDVPLIAALGAAGDIVSLPVVGYRYFIDGESISNNLSAEKEYRFVAGVVRVTGRLGKYYQLSPSDQTRTVKKKFPYMASQIRHSGNYALLEDLAAIIKEWDVKMPLRGKLHIALVKLRKLIGKWKELLPGRVN